MADQTKYTQKLKGKKALIIGGSAGIGYSVAEALLESGATVIISSSNQQRIEQAISKLKTSYPSAKDRVSGHAANLGDEASLEKNITTLLDTAGTLDHIVFTAGDSLATMKLSDTSLDKIKQAGMVRFFAPLLLAKHAPAHLNPGPESSITLTTGAVSERPTPDWAVVASYATGLQGMTRSLALDLKPVRVNIVSPGAVDTELWAGFPEESKKAFFAEIEKKLPTGKVGRPEDVAEAYLYLMKDKNITGSMISTNGGTLVVG